MKIPVRLPRPAAAALLLWFPAGVSAQAQGTLRISEFMAANTSSRTLANQPMYDENKSYEDWIEIHNGGAEAVDLGGWSLTDNPAKLRKWTFPRITLVAGARLIVWASNKNRTDPALPLHTNFKLSSGGGYLALVARDGETVVHDWGPSYPPQSLNTSYGYSFDGDTPVFFTTLSKPTPGVPNLEGVATIPPLVLEVAENKPAPEPGAVSIPITARVIATQAEITSVTLSWKKMFEADVTAPMHDDGLDGDETAGDGVWTGLITGVTLNPGQMLRWKVAATDSEARVGKAPPNNIPATAAEPNASAAYYGTVAKDPSLASSRLPVVHWFAQSTSAGDSSTIARISISYGGEFYDNVGVNIHGQSTTSFPKRSYNLNFPKDRNLLLEPGGKRVSDLKLLSNYADKTKARNTLAYELYREAGVAAHFAFPVRVQRNGAFYAIADAVEDADESYLERSGMNPDGALYKLYSPLATGLGAGESGYEKKTRKTETSADLNALATGMNLGNEPRLVYGYDNVDIPSTVNSLAALNMSGNNDTGHKNYYLFRDTGRTDEWRLLPWDVDLSFGHNWTGVYGYFDDDVKANNDAGPTAAPGAGNTFFRFGYVGSTYPSAISDMYLRRLRTLRDKFFAPSGTDDWINRRFNEMLALVDPPEEEKSDAELDFAKWAPPAWMLSGSASAFKRNTPAQETARVLTDYMAVRRKYFYTTMTTLPAAQPAVPALTFGAMEVNPGGLNSQNQEYFSVVNPTPLAIDVSGWRVTGAVDFVFPAGTVIPSVTRATTADPNRNRIYIARDARGFRARTVSPKKGEKRFLVSGYTGQLSARGESLELLTDADAHVADISWPATPTASQLSLRVSEIHYAPTPPTEAEKAALPTVVTSDFEFIELLNTGTSTLDLGGARIEEGVKYTIPAGVTLAPGARLVIAADPAAFNLRYTGVFALGPWDGRLDNSGERVQLLDPSGESVIDFEYSPEWFPNGEENGESLIIVDAADTPWEEWGLNTRWTNSGVKGGTPGLSGTEAGMTYALWKAALPAPAPDTLGPPEADTDGDGQSNLLEYALSSSPLAAAALPQVEALLAPAGSVKAPALQFRRPKNAADLGYMVQTSPDLAQWSEPLTVIASQPVDHGDGTETVTVRLVNPAPARLHLRLRVTGKP